MSGRAFPRFTILAVFLFLTTLPGFGASQVRIVRLSYVDGDVQIARNNAKFEKAFLNLPITQGMELRTSADGRAEVEFEDGSTLHLVANGLIRFSELSLDSGTKLSTVEVVEGTVYVDFVGNKSDHLNLRFAHENIALSHSAHLRIAVADKGPSVAVFKGEIQVESPAGASEVKKNETAEFAFADHEQLKLVKNIEEEPYDTWDKQQNQYHERYTASTYTGYSTYNYGLADLNYYGNFFGVPAYGMVWQPYFISAEWDPFMEGAWMFSPGFGYGWVSAYPWGWAPYHYGTWIFLPGYGWAWQPGGAWTSFYTPRVRNAPSRFVLPHPPVSGTNTLMVSRGPVPVDIAHGGSKIVIRNNSAGLGVPRGEVNNLSRVSQQVQTHGAVTEHIRPAPVGISGPPRGMGEPTPGSSFPRAPERSMPPPPPPRIGRMPPPPSPVHR